MDLLTHHINGYEIAEIISGELIIKSAEDGVDLLGNVYYQGFDRLILQHHHIVPDFFFLKPESRVRYSRNFQTIVFDWLLWVSLKTAIAKV